MRKACVYCGRVVKKTNDHIPPKFMFSKPRPQNMITVPSCEACNQKWKLDDEYFVTLLSFKNDLSEHPDIQKNIDKILKSLMHKKSKGFLNKILQDSCNIQLKTKSGIYIGKRRGIVVDWSRIYRVIRRIVRGLYYHETKQILPLNVGIAVSPMEEEDFKSAVIQENTLRKVLSKSPYIVGKDAFAYWFSKSEKEFGTVWVLVFFDRLVFLAITIPPLPSLSQNAERRI